MMTTKPTIRCASCFLERATAPTKGGELRVPRGWGRKPDGEIVCGACWDKAYVLRAVSLAIAEPVSGTWTEFDAVCRIMWRMTTQACNWIATELYARDVRRLAGAEKMPPMPAHYLYPELRAELPELPSQTVAALLNSTTAKYRAMRYEVIWRRSAALPTYRYPAPFPVPAQGWSIERDETGQRFVVGVRIGDMRWQLRLAGGARYRRQTEALADLVAGNAVPGEMALYRQRVDGKDRTMCKLVAYLPRKVRAVRGGDPQALIVRTDADSLLVALNRKDEKIWTYNADHLRRWSAEHRNQLQRWADDSKYEQRPTPAFAERREAAARKYRSRMDSAVREIAAQLVGYAERRRFAVIEYTDRDTSYLPAFPWFLLRERIATVCDEREIEFVHAAEVVAEGV
jgi:hypothetical protein